MNKRAKLIVVGAVVAVMLIGAFIASAIYTDRPAFCLTCHEMKPYYDAWATGPHKSASCIDCHVDPGIVAQFAHKFVALKEVYEHFAGDTKFPRATPPDVPSARCVRCHDKVPAKLPNGFPHAVHATKGECAECHFETGHVVTTAALKAAGIFAAGVVPKRLETEKVKVGRGVALVDHLEVSCSRCHDMKATPCSACHETPKDHPDVRAGQECTVCHAVGPKFVFTHPSDKAKCSPCHEPPKANHPALGGNDCSLCHKVGPKFVFTHPASKAKCASCHRAPSKGHPSIKGRDCSLCHRVAKRFSFTHPGGSCATCHKRPGPPHPSNNSCTSCHRSAGRSWAFSHSGSSACGSCHRAPGSPHPSSGSCSSCHHSPGRSWSFSHPSAGEHSWRSKPCSKCHPKSYSVVYCTCHKGRPPTDD